MSKEQEMFRRQSLNSGGYLCSNLRWKCNYLCNPAQTNVAVARATSAQTCARRGDERSAGAT